MRMAVHRIACMILHHIINTSSPSSPAPRSSLPRGNRV